MNVVIIKLKISKKLYFNDKKITREIKITECNF